MANRFYDVRFVVPAGTAIATPLIQDISFPDGVVTGVHVQIPNGHCGLTGLQFLQALTQQIPSVLGTWIQGDGLIRDFPVDGLLNNGDWQLKGYNTDVYDHAFYVRLMVEENPDPRPKPGNFPLALSSDGQVL